MLMSINAYSISLNLFYKGFIYNSYNFVLVFAITASTSKNWVPDTLWKNNVKIF